MRLQHLTRIAGSLSSDGPERAAAKTVIVETVERLRWRLWNGKAQNARLSLDQIRAVMHHFWGEPDGRRSVTPSRKLWCTAPGSLDNRLRYAACLKVCSSHAACASSGLRWPFFSISHSAL